MNQRKSSKDVATPKVAPMKNVTPASDATAAFLREVDEAMHQERLLEIWHKTKWFIVAAGVAIVLTVAGREAWQVWKTHQARTMANQWYAYSQLKTDAERAQELPQLLQTSDEGVHALAVFAQAGMQHTGAEKAKAYGQLVYDNSAPQWLRDIARLNGAIALMNDNPKEAKAQLEVLAQTKVDQLPSPAYAPALELLSLMAQQDGDAASAKGYTQKILQLPGLPSDMRQRALQRMGALGGVQE